MKIKNQGFSLIELSVVMVIIGVLTVGFLQGNALLLQKNKISATKRKIETIQSALANYLLINNNLPCPAVPTLTEASENFGVEGNCVDNVNAYSTNFIYGTIPTATLNLDNEMMKDEWGNKFSYVVHLNYTSQGTGFINMNPTGTAISVRTYTAESTYSTITTQAVYTVISHGENKVGGWGYNSGVQDSTTGNSLAEDLNIDEAVFDGSVANYYYSENFDDIVCYKTKNQLIMDLDWEDIGCYIDTDLRNDNEPNATCYDSFTSITDNYLDFNEDYEWSYDNPADSEECCVAKCYKYGRLGFYLKGAGCR